MIDHKGYKISIRYLPKGMGTSKDLWFPFITSKIGYELKSTKLLLDNGERKMFTSISEAIKLAKEVIDDQFSSEAMTPPPDSELEALRSELAAARERIAELKTLIFRATGFMESHIYMVERNDRVPATFEKLFLAKLQQALKGEVK